MMRLGVIGLGRMGRELATRLLSCGFDLRVWARRQASTVPLVALGATEATSAEALAREVECVVTCLPRPADVAGVLTAVLRAARPGSLLVETSTIDPRTSHRLATVAAARGVAYVDAPVSGSPRDAAEGALTLLVGGVPHDVERARPVLTALGRDVHHMGPAGSGHLAMLCARVVTTSACAALAEALVLGVRGGLDPERLRAVVASTSMRNRTLDRAGDAILARAFEAECTADLAGKDLECALEAGNELAVRLPLASAARRCYEELRRLGLGDLDEAAVIIPAEQFAGITIRANPTRAVDH